MKRKWMTCVLFDVGSENYYPITLYVECEGTPEEIAKEEALEVIKSEMEDCEGVSKDDIVDVLAWPQSEVDNGFKQRVIKR